MEEDVVSELDTYYFAGSEKPLPGGTWNTDSPGTR